MDIFNSSVITEVGYFCISAFFNLIIVKVYNDAVSDIKYLQEIETKEANKELEDIQSGDKSYTIVRGPVKGLRGTIPSSFVPNIFGVIQKLTTRARILERNKSGKWSIRSNPTHESYNVVPFGIFVGKHVIKVQHVEDVAIGIQLDTVYNKYDRIIHSSASNLSSFAAAERGLKCGVETTEQMLKEGTVVTGIGDLSVLEDGSMSLQPPGDKPYIITTQPISAIINEFEGRRIIWGTLLIVTGSVTLFFGSKLLYRLWKKLKKRREKLEMHRRLEASRRLQWQNALIRDNDLSPILCCVVCQANPKEVIMLPCGHFCACEDCSERLGSNCPICRAHIVTKAAAFLS